MNFTELMLEEIYEEKVEFEELLKKVMKETKGKSKREQEKIFSKYKVKSLKIWLEENK